MSTVADVRRAVDAGVQKIVEAQAASQLVTEKAEELPVAPLDDPLTKAAQACMALAENAGMLNFGGAGDAAKEVRTSFVAGLRGSKSPLIEASYAGLDIMDKNLGEANTASAAYTELLRGLGETILGAKEHLPEADGQLAGVTATQEEVRSAGTRAIETIEAYVATL
jgi:hypothetical protein